jgi:hypothetical protein
MRLLEIYVYFGLPLIALAMGFGALWLTKPRKDHQERKTS